MADPSLTFTEMVAPPPGGRQFTLSMRPGLGDCAPSGRLRLDALARWLQDVAYGDVEDAGVAAEAFWVVRRQRIRVRRWPRFAERFAVTTFCSGLGRMWAERRTSVRQLDGDGTPETEAEPDIETVALWVHLDPATRRPFPFTDHEVRAYGDAAAARRITARLRHSLPASARELRRFTFRGTDCDVAGHVNNAAYWAPLEEELLELQGEPGAFDGEMEFRAGAQPGEAIVLGAGPMRWVTDSLGTVLASVAVPGLSAVPDPVAPVTPGPVPTGGSGR